MTNRLEKILLAIVFPLALAGVIKFTCDVSKIQDRLDNPTGIATYTVQPGDNLCKLYDRFARRDIPLKWPWIWEALDYNPQLENANSLQAGMTIRLPTYSKR
jgi:hypothetical protein